MSVEFDQRARDLAGHYRHFRVSERLLLTGHSHQAWPDIALDGQREAFEVAARDVDAKWGVAFAKTEVLRSYLRDYYDDPDGLYSFSSSTHDLLVRWLSSFDLAAKPRIITTDGEFHAMRRQLRRLAEEGLDVVFIEAEPQRGFTERLRAALDERTSAVCLSRVYFKTGLIQPELSQIAVLCREAGVPLLIDDYHGTNVVPLSLRDAGLEECFLVGGGYKYLQWGEGNCFLRFPASCTLRPVITGWFSSFSTLEDPRSDAPVAFDEGDGRFVGATYDPTSQFRAAR
ncbi:MAG: aminotransferase class V-fold PLP-dependent enzyme, partial [Myxococcota bacterium]